MYLNRFYYFLLFFFLVPLISSAQNWQSVESLNTPRVGASAAVWNHQIYVFGGKTSGNEVLNSVEKYDPITGSWDTLSVPAFTEARYNASAVVFRNKIYLIGGRNNTEVFKEIEIYDPVQNSWNSAQELRRRREGHTAVVFNDTLTVLGGIEDQYQYVDEIEWYNETEDKWEKRDSSLFQGRAAAYIATFRDKLYMCGGTYFGLKDNSFVANAHFAWNNGPLMQTGRSYGGMVEVDDFLYMIGGETLSGVSARVEVYNPYTWNIEQGVNLPSPRSGLVTVALSDTIYAIGGWSVNHYQILNSVEYIVPQPTAITDPISQTIPDKLMLLEAFPNPFNGMIQFQLELSQRNQYEFNIYDINGRLVANIFSGNLAPGMHRFQWDASSSAGYSIATGIYFAILQNNRNFQKLKIIYVK